MRLARRYAEWLHTGWPAGQRDLLPEVREEGRTALPGVYVVGDLAGVPLLKFALEGGARAAREVAAELASAPAPAEPGVLDLLILGAGVAGMSAALEARRLGVRTRVLESSTPFATLVDMPQGKPIYAYPRSMSVEAPLRISADTREPLIEELRRQTLDAGLDVVAGRAERIEPRGGRLLVHRSEGEPIAARRVIVAIGRTGSFRRLRVPGEDRERVHYRLHDPADFAGQRALVVGGGDNAVETAVALAKAGASVTLVHRGRQFSRPKPENLAALESARGPAGSRGSVEVHLESRVRSIQDREVTIQDGRGDAHALGNDVVFIRIGRDAPLDFFRRSRLPISGEMTAGRWLGLAAFVMFCAWLYNWKSGGFFSSLWYQRHWFPTNLPELLAGAGSRVATAARDRRTLLGTIAISASSPSFYYTIAYSTVVAWFGIRRIRRRRTPYVTVQTLTLIAIQVLPLFLLPEILLPWLDANGELPRPIADALFPAVSYGHGREFWRAYGLILAWPLDVYNVFTHQPLGAWLVIGFVQTFVLIPLAVYFFGKGAYCGWICSCGALAETLGDTHRHKMPHGPRWNRLNLAGQGVLALALVLLAARIAGWALPPGNPAARLFEGVLEQNYKWWIDVFLAGVVGYGAYFWFSGRVWCRFFCPLAALMHVYARFSRFRILADKPRCISCGMCTTQCHQGIDVMSFANRGISMADPECVRCSACVQVCPTGVLQFGQVNRAGAIVSIDSLAASPVRMREKL